MKLILKIAKINIIYKFMQRQINSELLQVQNASLFQKKFNEQYYCHVSKSMAYLYFKLVQLFNFIKLPQVILAKLQKQNVLEYLEQSLSMNNIIFLPNMKQIPQWDSCYFDYDILEDIIVIVNDSKKALAKVNRIQSKLKKQKKKDSQLNQSKGPLNNQVSNLDVSQILMTQSAIAGSSALIPFEKIDKKQDQLIQIKQSVQKIQNTWRINFLTFSYQSSTVAFNFVQMKMYEVNDKYREYTRLLQTVKHQRKNILVLRENEFIQTTYLQKAIRYNIYQEVRITQNFQQLLSKNQYKEGNASERGNITRLKRTQIKTSQIRKGIQSDYFLASDENYKEASKTLYNLIAGHKAKTYSRSFIVGIIMSIMFFLVLLIAGAQMYSVNTTDFNLQTDNKFTNYFPIWRGASYMVFYLWMLTMDVVFYEKSQINYGLVFQLRSHNMPQSNYLLTYTSALSIVYFVLFFIFTLEIRGILHSNFMYEGAVFWVLLLANFLILNPLTQINEKKSRFYLHKILLKVILTPCIPMNMIIIWVTQQLSSFNQPFGDLFYTVCFVSSKNLTFCKKNAPYSSTAYILFIFLYRMIQNMKMWCQNAQKRPDKKLNFSDPPFIGFFRGLLSSITTIFALLQRLKLFNGTFGIWLTLVIITTFYSWYIDVKYDWGILNLQSKTLLRQKLLFPNAKILYYFFALFNLVLRTAWVITISPIFFATKGFFNLIFIMIVSYLQILRRGIWNILRIQNEHIKNCGQFKATVNDSNILEEVREAAKMQQVEKNQMKKRENLLYERQQINEQNNRRMTQKIQKFDHQSKILADERLKEAKSMFKQNLAKKQRRIKQIKQQLAQDKSALIKLRKRIKELNTNQ